MMDAQELPERVLRFIAEQIDSVPQLEALLLLWREPDRWWNADEIASRVYVSREVGQHVLRSLTARQLATFDAASGYRFFCAGDDSLTLLAEVDSAYRRHLVTITKLIHSGASSSVRDFARAFELKKDR